MRPGLPSRAAGSGAEVVMAREWKRIAGLGLALVGGAGIVAGPSVGVGALGAPWPFVLGLLTGAATGAGVALFFASSLASRQDG